LQGEYYAAASGLSFCFSRTGGSRARVWGHMVSAECEPITGDRGRAPSRVQEQRPWSGGQGSKPLKLNVPYICTTRKVGQFVLKSFLQNKKSSHVWGACPLDPLVFSLRGNVEVSSPEKVRI